jgi:hypothetical protein
MPHPVLVFVAFLSIPNPTFHFGTVTSLLYLSFCLCYLSGNIPLTNAYSGQDRTEHGCASAARNTCYLNEG